MTDKFKPFDFECQHYKWYTDADGNKDGWCKLKSQRCVLCESFVPARKCCTCEFYKIYASPHGPYSNAYCHAPSLDAMDLDRSRESEDIRSERISRFGEMGCDEYSLDKKFMERTNERF
jgi:hypothetical protein